MSLPILLFAVCTPESPIWEFHVTQRNWLGGRLGEISLVNIESCEVKVGSRLSLRPGARKIIPFPGHSWLHPPAQGCSGWPFANCGVSIVLCCFASSHSSFKSSVGITQSFLLFSASSHKCPHKQPEGLLPYCLRGKQERRIYAHKRESIQCIRQQMSKTLNHLI